MRTQRENRANRTKRSKGEIGKLVTVCPLIQTKARGQFLPLTRLCLTPKCNQETKKIHVFTCCKCFPTACMLTLIRPVSCVWSLMHLLLKHGMSLFPWGTPQVDGLHRDLFYFPTAELCCCLYVIFEKQKITSFLKNYRSIILNIDQMLYVKKYSF